MDKTPIGEIVPDTPKSKESKSQVEEQTNHEDSVEGTSRHPAPDDDCKGDPQAEKTPRLNFDIEAALKCIGSPETPIHVMFLNALELATENIKNGTHETYHSPEIQYSFMTRLEELNKKKQILKGVRVYVCQNLLEKQIDLFKIVDSLGGDHSWFYCQGCTHFIYNGELSDDNKELKVAKDEGKIIVRPSWLYECQKQGNHVDEHEHFISNQTSMICETEQLSDEFDFKK